MKTRNQPTRTIKQINQVKAKPEKHKTKQQTKKTKLNRHKIKAIWFKH